MPSETEPRGEMPFLKHLEELRLRILWSAAAILIASIASYAYSDVLFRVLMKPLCDSFGDEACQLHFTGLAEPFVVYIKVSILSGLLASSPFILLQTWRFMAPGLYRRERRVLWPFLALSTVLFATGALFGYFFVFPFGFRFFLGYASHLIRPIITVREYFGLATTMLLTFGLVFELPLAILLLSLMGIVTSQKLLAWWRYAVVIIAIASAILTPADPWTMILMAVPLTVLYFLSILLVMVFERRPRATAADT